jgi:hypothetical protein
VVQSEIVHVFLEGMTCQDLVRELGCSPPVDSNELFDIATSFASGVEAVGSHLRQKEGQARGRCARGGQQVQGASAEAQRGKKGKKPRHEAHASGATTTGTGPSLSTQLEGALERPLKAPACLTTC